MMMTCGEPDAVKAARPVREGGQGKRTGRKLGTASLAAPHWLDGGISCYENGCLLCRLHHTEVHKGYWKIKWGADGIPEFIPPPWVDPEQKPRRNNTHRVADLLK